jgi:lysozyme
MALVLSCLISALAVLGSVLPEGHPAGATVIERPPLRTGQAYGVDVASFQGAVAWPLVARDGVSFAYIKATQGTTYVNPFFDADWRGAKAAGLAYGAYHFFSLCSSGAAQARRFLRVVPRDPTALPPAVDLELKGNCAARPSRAAVASALQTFVQVVQGSTHRPVVFYVGLDFAALYKLQGLQGHPLWLRRNRRPAQPVVVIWQPRAGFEVDGIAGPVDLDLARLGTLRALH